jgi:hypothetical protein
MVVHRYPAVVALVQWPVVEAMPGRVAPFNYRRQSVYLTGILVLSPFNPGRQWTAHLVACRSTPAVLQAAPAVRFASMLGMPQLGAALARRPAVQLRVPVAIWQ